ncbi:MAG: trigger factor [Coriobacteriales bacterium]|nr:trigger factor [Coriobacteriales bacterium]
MSQLVGGTLKTSAERLEDNIVEITVTVDADDVKKSVASTYKDIANKYKFPGFRPGHAPRKVIDNNVGKQAVLSEATESLVNEVLPLVLEKEDLVPVTDPMYPRPAMVEDAKDFEFKVRFGVRPELTLTSCDPVAIKLPSEEATEAEIDSQIETFRGYFGKYQDIEGRSIEAGDSVYIKCKGGENAESIDFENRLYKLGSGHMPATFDEGLIGLNPGDSKTITFALPVEEPKEGEEAEEPKNAVVDVTVNRLVERVLPELTDEFAKNNFGFDDIAAMREAISKEIGEQKKQAIPQIKENRVTGKLAERLEGEPSRPYLATIYQELGQNFMNQLQARGMTFDTWLAMNNITAEQFGNDLERQATDIAKESLALDALVREKGFECTDEDLDEEFKKSGIEDWEAAKKQFLEDGRMPAVRVSVRRNKAIDWLLETAEVTVSDEPDVPAEEPKKEAKEEKPAKKRSSKKAEAKEEAPEAEEKPKKKTSRKTTTEAAD